MASYARKEVPERDDNIWVDNRYFTFNKVPLLLAMFLLIVISLAIAACRLHILSE